MKPLNYNSESEKFRNKINDDVETLKSVLLLKALSIDEKDRIKNIINDFEGRVRRIKLNLGIIGEFNAGKSTLINCILGEKIAATGNRPCTPVPIYISGSEKYSLTIFYESGDSQNVSFNDFEKYSTYEENSRSLKMIKADLPNEFLVNNDLVMIDTPGINAINPIHTKITESVLPEMHAAILLIYSKQPGSKSTIEFLTNASEYINKIFVCVSKSDFLNESQLERIISELPKRLSNQSGIKVDKVWPIHITEDAPGQDFIDFMNFLRNFMLNEWFNVISKDLSKILKEYSLRTKEIIEEKMILQENLFYEYVDKSPVDFSNVSTKIKKEAKIIIENEFNKEEISEFIISLKNNVYEEVNYKLKEILKPEKMNLGFIKKRIDKQTFDLAVSAITKIHSNLINNINIKFEEKCNNVIEKIKEASKIALMNINEILDNFDKKLLDLYMRDKSVIEEAKLKSFKKFLYIPFLLLAAFAFSFIFNNNILIGSEEWKYATIILFLISIIIIYFNSRKPSSELLNKVARDRITSLERFQIPVFSHELNKNIRFYSGSDTGLTTHEKLSSYGRGIGNMGTQLGNNALAGIGMAIAAFSYFNLPKAEELYQQMLNEYNNSLSGLETIPFDTVDQLSEELTSLSSAYIDSMPNLYKNLLDSAFNINSELIKIYEETLEEVKIVNQKLSLIINQ